MRLSTSRWFAVLVVLVPAVSVAAEDSRYYAFIGKKISVEPVARQTVETRIVGMDDGTAVEEVLLFMDELFTARYEVLETVYGKRTSESDEIEFSVADHYGTPEFAAFEHALIYVIRLDDGGYHHSKYQYSPMFRTKGGTWAAPYSAYDYDHSYNQDTSIRPVRIDFAEPVVFDLAKYDDDEVADWFPSPYYTIEGGKAKAVYGNFVSELIELKRNGVMKARGDFQ